MATLISNNQTAFIKGRNITDNTVLVREILHSFQSRNYIEKSFLLKADITKAFDTVKWSFVMQAMKMVQFPSSLMKLIESYLSLSRVTILVNGSGQGFITPTRARDIKRIKLAKSDPPITYILYADDLMVMGQANVNEVREIKKVFEVFEQQSGLVIHPEKSTIWYSNSCDEASKELVSLEFSALAVLPTKTIKEINAILRRFLWGKTGNERFISFISWQKICESIENGGLGIRDMKTFNQALILKMVWQLASNSDKLWVQIFKAKYFSKAGLWAIKNKRDASPLWREIQDLKHILKDQLGWHVGQGTRIKALNEPWFTGCELQHITTNAQRDAMVADIFDEQQGCWRAEMIEGLMGNQAHQNIMASGRKPNP
ncbi:uncharacterized protein LOC144562969 [Carex rostrata]